MLLCGRQDDARYKQAMSKRSPEARLRAFLALCGSKRVCEHTGGPQPAYRVDGMRIMAEFPKPKDDDGMDSFADVERKQEVCPPAADGALRWQCQKGGGYLRTCADSEVRYTSSLLCPVGAPPSCDAALTYGM